MEFSIHPMPGVRHFHDSNLHLCPIFGATKVVNWCPSINGYFRLTKKSAKIAIYGWTRTKKAGALGIAAVSESNSTQSSEPKLPIDISV
jgi:hypothetical protein